MCAGAAVTAFYDVSGNMMTRDGTAEEEVLEAIIDKAQRAAGVKKEIRATDYRSNSPVNCTNSSNRAPHFSESGTSVLRLPTSSAPPVARSRWAGQRFWR